MRALEGKEIVNTNNFTGRIAELETKVQTLVLDDGKTSKLGVLMQEIHSTLTEYKNTLHKALAEADVKFEYEMTSELSNMKLRFDNMQAVAVKKIDQLNFVLMDRVRFVDDRLLRESAHGDRLAAKMEAL